MIHLSILSWYAGKDSLKSECMLLMKNNVKSCALAMENKTFTKSGDIPARS